MIRMGRIVGATAERDPQRRRRTATGRDLVTASPAARPRALARVTRIMGEESQGRESTTQPVRLHAFLMVRDGISPVAFHAHWRDVHGPLAARVRRADAYVQAHRLPWQPEDLPVLPHGGAAQMWFASYEVASGLMDDPDYTENAAHDEDNFHHMDRMTALQTRGYVAHASTPIERETGGVKVLQLVRRAAGIERSRFREEWLGPLDGDEAAVELGVVRHERGAAVEEADADTAAGGYDGIRELWWPDVWCFMAAREQRPAWQRLVSAPALDPAGSGFLVTTEYRLIWRRPLQ